MRARAAPGSAVRVARLTWREERAPAAAALAATIATLLLGVVVFATYAVLRRPVRFALDFRVEPFYGPLEACTHLSTIKHFFDARGQSLAHLAVAVATASLAFGGLRGGVRWEPGSWPAWLVVLTAGFAGYQLPGPRAAAYLGGLAVLLLFIIWSRPLSTGWSRRGLLIVVFVLLGVSTLPGFLHPPDYTAIPWWVVAFSEAHYAVVVAPADLLGAGRALFADVRPDYGLLLSVLVGGFERRYGPLDLGAWVRLLLFLQTLYLVLAAVVFLRHARGRSLPALLALLTVLPWYHFAHKALRFPNQTPWRTIGMALALAAFAFLGRVPRRRTLLLLGIASGLAVLLNFESGVAVMAGAVAYACVRFGLLRREEPPGQRLRAGGVFSLGFLLALLSALALVPVALGAPLDPRHLPRLLANAAFTASGGFSGFPLTADPLPLVMLAHAVFVLLVTAFGGPAPRGPRTAFRAAAATMLVVWFAYYANRPDPWNLSSYFLLYGVLLVDLLRFAEQRVRRRVVGPGWAATMAVLLFVVLPSLAFGAAKGYRQVHEALGPALQGRLPDGARLLSGAFFADPAASELETRARFLATHSGSRPVYLTTDSYLIPKLTGAFPDLPVVDFCWQATTRRDYERVLGYIVSSGAREVYFDAPGTIVYDASYCAAFYDRVREDLSRHFERAGTEAGWEIWKRR